MFKKVIKILAIFALFMGVIFGGLISYTYATDPRKEDYSSQRNAWKTEISESKLWEVVNTWREDNNLNQYIKDEVLCNYAESRISEIKNDWSHDGFKSMEKIDNFSWLGENLSKETFGENQTLQMWLESPEHRENLEKDFTHSCIKCDNNYCVQIFGK